MLAMHGIYTPYSLTWHEYDFVYWDGQTQPEGTKLTLTSYMVATVP